MPAREAHRAAGPRPWRAWVRPAGARAHHHLHQITLGTKAGSQHKPRSPPAARPGTARRRQGPDSPAWPAPSQTPGKGDGSRPGFSAGVRWLRHRVSPELLQNGVTAKTTNQKRDARGHPDSTARRDTGTSSLTPQQGSPKLPP
jgi:hypothetical protein